jgi:hypothetical protein
VYFSAVAPFYNLHKLFAGLREAWLYCDSEEGKDLFLNFCDWEQYQRDLSDDQWKQSRVNTVYG